MRKFKQKNSRNTIYPKNMTVCRLTVTKIVTSKVIALIKSDICRNDQESVIVFNSSIVINKKKLNRNDKIGWIRDRLIVIAFY